MNVPRRLAAFHTAAETLENRIHPEKKKMQCERKDENNLIYGGTPFFKPERASDGRRWGLCDLFPFQSVSEALGSPHGALISTLEATLKSSSAEADRKQIYYCTYWWGQLQHNEKHPQLLWSIWHHPDLKQAATRVRIRRLGSGTNYKWLYSGLITHAVVRYVFLKH